MTLSPSHRLVWAGLDKVAWDNVGSQSALQHEFHTPWPTGAIVPPCWGYKSPARHSSWTVRAVGQAQLLVCTFSVGYHLLFDLDRVQVPVAESRWDTGPADRLTDRKLHKTVVAAVLPLSSLS